MNDDTVEKNEENVDNQNESEAVENTPAGSYQLPGQDTSGFLGVDPEYMNSATPGGQAILTESERYLFLPADADDEDEQQVPEVVVPDDADEAGAYLDAVNAAVEAKHPGYGFVPREDDPRDSDPKAAEQEPQTVEVSTTPARPVL